MNTLQNIFYFEWVRLKKSNLFLCLTIILIILFGTAFYTGVRHFQFRKDTIAYIQKTEQENYKKSQEKARVAENDPNFKSKSPFRDPTHPIGVGWMMGNRAFFMKPTAWSFISIGDSDFRPNYYKTSLFKNQTLFHNSEIENASVLYNKHFDLGFVLIFILPLICIALTYNIASYDRENGTMGILLSGTKSFQQIIATRFLFRGGVIFGLCAMLLVLGIVLTGNTGVILSVEFLLILLTIVSYITLWCSIAYWIGSLRKSSSFNISSLASIWLVVVILLPSIIKEFSTKVYPMPSKIDLIAREREVADSVRQKSDKILSKYMDDHPELIAGATQVEKNKATYTRFSTAAEVEKIMKPLKDTHETKIDEQEHFIEMYRFFSPVIMMQRMVDYISGNSRDRYKEFNTQFLDFRKEYKAFFITKIFAGEKIKSTDYDLIPKKDFNDKKTGESSIKFITNVLVIVLMAMGLILISNKKYKK